MNSIKVLDVTLRDGGCVIDFNFGQAYMDQILEGLEKSQVDIIELGYLDEKKGSAQERTQFCDEQVIKQHFLKAKKPGTTYVAMFDYGKFDPNTLAPYDGTGIDGLRIAFHKKDRLNMVPLARKVLEKGYQLYIQPMTIMRYTDAELLELLDTVNTELADATAFYVVDSFGEMRMNDLNRIVHLVDHNLKTKMTMGFHSHNNLQLSYSNAVTLLQFFSGRNMIIDSSVLGMGKGAGNLNTELFLEHLNLYYGKHYRIAPLLEVIDQVLNTIRAEHYWGYSIEYYLSSINHCTPSYAGHFYKKHMLPVEQVAELLSLIAEEKKISFDRDYAEQLYLSYNARRHQDDDPAVRHLTEVIRGKRVLLLAPGKRLEEGAEAIREALTDPGTVSVSLNSFDRFDTDYVLTTRADAFCKALKSGKRIIATTGVCDKPTENVLVLDYEKWVTMEEGVQDSSGIVALKLMTACGASELLLAGFDGFSVDINKNYYDKTMRHPVTEEQARQRNAYFRTYVQRLRATVPVRFLTRSLYEA
ncbi:aldolase catalytic domain-containing protein [Dysosmobacter sp. Sow4_B12]|uniref:aldolase catalytic domain-containing protein n=1 Tax=Dysosmobacter sp. Sow4_B12 TaxID=3438777 RepID=UPI003F8F547B